jgi:competence ComEA-like helix-hairpin-helix protein
MRPVTVLSTATEDELCRLPGIGPAIARRIVVWRAENGGFDSVDQLAQIRGISRARVEALRPHVAAREPQPSAGPQPARRPILRRRVPDQGAGPARPDRDDRTVGRGRTRLDRPVPEAADAEPGSEVTLSPARVRAESRRALERRRLPATIDEPASGLEPERGLGPFLRDNGVNVALVGLAVAVQVLVIALVVWVL